MYLTEWLISHSVHWTGGSYPSSVSLKGIFMEERVYHLEDKLNFGKYKGKTVHQILHTDGSYLKWAYENISWFSLDDGVYTEACDKSEEEKRQHYIDNLDYIDYYDFCGGDDY